MAAALFHRQTQTMAGKLKNICIIITFNKSNDCATTHDMRETEMDYAVNEVQLNDGMGMLKESCLKL